MSARALYLAARGEPFLGLLHEPAAEAARGSAVLLCPPFGWDEVASYRSRRVWAGSLAEAGHLVLRIDLPGTGDSAGGPRDPERLATWIEAVKVAAAWLREAVGGGSVALAGTGLGGIAGALAAGEGAEIDDLILWAVPAKGRRFTRELTAFAAMEDAALGALRAANPVETGAVEAGGFLLCAETVEALGTVDLGRPQPAPAAGRRALLLERDGIAPDDALRGGLEEQGFAVTVAPGPGYNRMHALPHDAEPALEVFATVEAWLAERAGGSGAGDRPPSDEACDGGAWRETPLTVAATGVDLFGILTEPAAGAGAGPTLVLLNAGAIRRSGPGRMWTEAARRWAAQGVAVLRLDVEGIGDAGGPDARDTDVSLYVPRFVEQVRSALDALEQRGHPGPYVVGGLCSGAYWAYHLALEDPRVGTALMLNPRILVWDPNLVEARAARELLARAHQAAWRRALRGEWTPRQLAQLSGRFLRARRVRARLDQASLADPTPVVERVEVSPARFVLAFSADEPLRDELAADGTLARLTALPNVELAELPGSDHTLRPLGAQHAAHAVIDRVVAGA